jgi:transporter family protein
LRSFSVPATYRRLRGWRPAPTAVWLPFALIALTGWGLWGFIQKPLTDRIDVWSIVFFEAVTTFMLSLLAAIVARERLGVSQRGIWVALLAGSMGYAGNVAFLAALDRGTASVIVPLSSMYPVVTITLSLIILKERLRPMQRAGIVLALAAILLLSY